MFAISEIGKRLLRKLNKKAYRHAYVAEHVRRGIAHQIRALREQRGWNQGRLSHELGKPQSVVCRIEDPDYGKFSIQTLLEVAAAYDVALIVKFVSFPTFLRQTRDLTDAAMQVPSFDLKAWDYRPVAAGSQISLGQPLSAEISRVVAADVGSDLTIEGAIANAYLVANQQAATMYSPAVH